MLQTHVKNDIYKKYCLIHNTIEKKSSPLAGLELTTARSVGQRLTQ